MRIYDHWEGDFRAATDAMDQMLEEASKNNNKEAFVSKMLAKSEELGSRPCRPRTCDTLILQKTLR